MPREVRMTICSGCIEEFPNDDLYTVSRYMNRANPNPKNLYTTPYCEDCVKKDKDRYVEITQEPKRILKEKAKAERAKERAKAKKKKTTKKNAKK